MKLQKSNKEVPFQKNEFIWLFLLFLACADFIGNGSTFMAILLFFYTVTHLRQSKMSTQVVLLFLFSLSYFICYWYNYSAGFSDILKLFFFPWTAYIFGSTYTRDSESRSPLLVLIFTIAGGLLLHGALNMISYRFFHRVDERHARLAYDIWRRGYISVTTQGLLFLIPIGVATGLLFSKNRKWMVLACLILIIAAYNAIMQAYRTFFVILGLLLIGVFLYMLLSSSISTKRKISIIFAVGLLILLCVIIWSFNIAGFRSRITSTRLYQRMTHGDIINAGGRVLIWKSFFKTWLMHPFGGEKIALYRNHDFVHNFWLDIYRVAGVFPFIFSIIANVNDLVVQRRYARVSTDRHTVIIIRCCTAAVILGFMVEPVYIANPYVYYCYLIIQGGIWGTMRRKGAYYLR